MLREQQKLGMTTIYKDFAQRAKLTPEQTDKLRCTGPSEPHFPS